MILFIYEQTYLSKLWYFIVFSLHCSISQLKYCIKCHTQVGKVCLFLVVNSKLNKYTRVSYHFIDNSCILHRNCSLTLSSAFIIVNVEVVFVYVLYICCLSVSNIRLTLTCKTCSFNSLHASSSQHKCIFTSWNHRRTSRNKHASN